MRLAATLMVRVVSLATAVGALAACSGSDDSELRAWMDETRKTMKVATQPVQEPRQFSPYSYSGKSMLDPFDAQRILQAMARQAEARASASTFKPDMDRRREALEAFTLDQLKMVGTLRQGDSSIALIDAAGLTYMVRVGNFLGQNFGQVVGITETEVQVKEMVQDAVGEWVEHAAKLELQEASAPAQGRKR